MSKAGPSWQVRNWAPVGNFQRPSSSTLSLVLWRRRGRTLETQGINGLLIIGGWKAYHVAHQLYLERERYPAFKMPMICLPASIDNNLPGSDLSIGADTALNVIVESLDRIKQSAMAARRCFVVEVMGRRCGYLAMMSGLAAGAERIYLPEEGITLKDLQADVESMTASFRSP